MVKKIISILVGVLAVAAVIYTGYLSFADETGYLTVLYGVVALLAPSAFSLIQWAFKKPDEMLQEIQTALKTKQLLKVAKQYEMKIESLKDENNKLLEIIQEESRLFMLQERKVYLEESMVTAQEELAEIDALLQEEPTSFKYLPDIIKRIEKETQEVEPSLEDKLLNEISFIPRSLIPNIFIVFYNLIRWLYKTVSAYISRRKNDKKSGE